MLTYEFSDEKSPKYRELYQKIRRDILAGTLKSGEKLPSKRTLAQNLGISTITVENAYDQLISEGYIFSEIKKGYFVSDMNSVTKIQSVPKAKMNISTSERKTFFFDFSSNNAETNTFPFSTWAKLCREVLSNMQQNVLQISPCSGVVELRKAIARHLLSFRGMDVDPNQVIVGAGTENLYEILIKLLGTEKKYCIENPGYTKIRKIYDINRIDYSYVDLDEKGISMRELNSIDADIVHISPNHHFPTGITMPASRRYEILGWANEKEGRYIIEDDYDSEFRQNGNPIPTLQSIDAFGKVIYLNTFSKSIASTLRISYMILPENLANLYYKTMSFYTCPVPTFEQYTLAKFIDGGYFEKHINRMRLHYRRKRQRVLEILRKNFSPYECTIQESDSGLHMILKLYSKKSDEKIQAELREHDININRLSEYYNDENIKLNQLYLLNYSSIELAKFEKTIAILKTVMH